MGAPVSLLAVGDEVHLTGHCEGEVELIYSLFAHTHTHTHTRTHTHTHTGPTEGRV